MIATTVERLRDLGGVLGSRIPGGGVEVRILDSRPLTCQNRGTGTANEAREVNT
jgi:hypothetical protein